MGRPIHPASAASDSELSASLVLQNRRPEVRQAAQKGRRSLAALQDSLGVLPQGAQLQEALLRAALRQLAGSAKLPLLALPQMDHPMRQAALASALLASILPELLRVGLLPADRLQKDHSPRLHRPAQAAHFHLEVPQRPAIRRLAVC